MNLDTEKTALEIERALGSLGKLRILRLLMKAPSHAFTRYEIGKTIPLNSVEIRNSMKTLVEIGWVKELSTQHLQKYSLNLENEVVGQLYDFFKKTKYV